MPAAPRSRLRVLLLAAAHGVFVFCLAISLRAAAPAATRGYDVPAGDADRALRLFSQQSGHGIVVGAADVKGVRTNAVKGEFTAKQALSQLLAGTGLVAAQDAQNGAFAVRRENSDPNAARAAQTRSDRPTANPPVETSPLRAAKPAGEETAIELSPFTVTSDKDTGFAAASSLAGGRLSGELRDTPVAYSVMTREFIDALGITDVLEATSWSTNNTERLHSGNTENVGLFGEYSTRGFQSAGGGGLPLRQRNFFPTFSLGDSYMLERYDFGRGPNSILFGNGSLGGVSSSTTKRAQTDRRFQTVKMSIGSWQSLRGELDINQPLSIPGASESAPKTAVRAALLWSDGDDWRDRVFDKRRGAFLTTTLKPFKHTEIRLEGEYFRNERQVARTDINDQFSGWDGTTTYAAPAALATLPNNSNALGVSRLGGTRYIFDPFGPAKAIMNYQNDPVTLGGGDSASTPIAGFTQVGTSSLGTSAATLIHAQAVPAGRFDTAIAKSFFRPISEEFTVVPDGPETIGHYQDLQLTVSQRVGEHFFFELAGDVNTSDLRINGGNNGGSFIANIKIDINQVLPNGAPNPNFLQPYSDYMNHRRHYSYDNRNLRGAAAYVAPANQFGKFAFNVIGGMNHRERNQDWRFLSLADDSDHRQWGNGATRAVFFRQYWNAPSRPNLGGYGSSGRDLGTTPVNYIDPNTGVSKVVQPRWVIENERADIQSLDTSDFNYVLASLNAKFFKDRLVLLGAVRYDTYKFAVDFQKARGEYPLDWDGTYRIIRPEAPADYFDLKYQPRNAAGAPDGPVQTAITRPRIAATSDSDPRYLNDRFQNDYNPPDLTGSQITKSVGTVLHLFSWFNPSFNYAETFNPPGGTPRINGQLHPATVANGSDYGLRMELFQRRLDLNFNYYESEEINAIDGNNFGQVSLTNLINANVVGDQSSTGINARGLAPLLGVFRDSLSRRAQGVEVEFAFNPTKALRLTGNYAKPKTGSGNRFPDYLGYIATNATAFRNIALDAGALIDAANVASVDQSIPANIRSPNVQAAVDAYNAIFQFQNDWTGRTAEIGDSQSRGNIFADYTFQNGWLKRLRVGAGVRYYGKRSIAGRANDSIVNPAFNPALPVNATTNPQAIDDPAADGTTLVYGPSYSIVTCTLAYSWKLKDRRELQANLVVNNLLNDRGPIYFNTALRPKGGDFTSPARETVFNQFQLKKPISYNLSLTMKL